MNEESSELETPEPPRWTPLSAIERRCAGVLVEKAKTTPEAYPMSLNAVTTACNQKNNRAPLMQLEPEQVAEALERLRHAGAVGLVEGSGRVQKYRHYLYDWLGIEKTELAVLAELLLRGDQTEGELRGRAARMEPINDLAALRPILESLKAKNLVVSLTPEGRGHVVSHNLYQPAELERLRAKYAGPRGPLADTATSATPAAAAAAEPVGRPGELESLRDEVAALAERLAAVEAELRTLRTALGEG